MPQGGARGQNLGHLRLFFCMKSFNEQHVPFRVFLSVSSDRKAQCPKVGLEVKIYDTPAGSISASQGTFSSK